MAATGVNSRRQEQLADFFEDLDSGAPDESIRPLTEIFHLARRWLRMARCGRSAPEGDAGQPLARIRHHQKRA